MAPDPEAGVTSPAEETYAQLLETATDALFVVGPEGRFEIANGEFLDLVGYERTELLGTPVTEFLRDDDAGEWAQHADLLRADDATESDTLVARIVTKHGSDVPVEFELSTLGGKIAGIARDVRQRQRSEQKLDILTRALRHNIRNRMNIVLGRASTLQEVDDEGYRTAAEQIEAVGEEIINLSNKVRKAQKYLDIPSDEECRMDLVEVTEQVVMQFEISYPTATVTTDLPDRALARAPPSVEVALTELLENAVVHHPSGIGPVAVEITTGDDRVRVHVKDACDPIPQAVVDCLERGEEQPLEHNEGLGLWMAQWAVETVGGDLTFSRRDDGDGNRVTLTFDALAS